MKEEFMPRLSDDTAEFNNAFAFLERLNKIEYMIEWGLMNWKLVDTFYALESYENELFFCFKKGNEEEVNQIKKDIVNILNEYPGIGTVKKQIGKNYIVGGEKTGELRNLLIKLNKKLRAIKHKGGMGMPTKGEGKLF